MTVPATKAKARAIGVPYYFTGKPCKNGHICKRKTSNSGCHECKKISDAIRRKTSEYKEMMRDMQSARRRNPAVKAKDSAAQSDRRKTDEYREKVRPFNREYKKTNRGKYNAYHAKRSAAQLQRTPSWISQEDKKEMLGIYGRARQLTKMTGEPHHVDHIIPLQGILVSGLHIPKNLQILTALENMQKNNSFKVAP